MKALQNEMILASAGSGKTYRLTNRFVHLLALGVPPERIIALTFTRKAAAEFLDEILKKLAKAASDPRIAQDLKSQLDLDDFDSRRALELLRLVIDRLHQLTLGTLDSFFHRILACFPAEFGLGTGFEVMNPHEESEARARVFAQIFNNRRLHTHFTEAFKKATFGNEEKSLQRKLDDFVSNHHRTYLRQPASQRWGDESVIWPNGARWLQAASAPVEAYTALRDAAGTLELDKTARGMWDKLIDLFASVELGKKLPSAPGAAFERVLEAYPSAVKGGPVPLKLGRKEYELSPSLCRALASLVDHYLFCEIKPHLERTRGIYEILEAFERDYHDEIRRSGKLGFEDIQMLLNGSLLPPQSRQHLSIDGGEGRLHVDYRLDGQFDHWLLDEFQDTSNGQWKVIANLIDEVLQDTEGRRSLFYVGDVKQAIFGWRGGDAALFNDIRFHYNSLQPDSIQSEHMEDSRRSGPALMEAVNRIFGDFDRLRSLFPDHPEFVERWETNWAPHTTHHQNRADYVELLTLADDPTAEEDASERRLAVVAGLVEEIAPHRKQLSCAILVRTNDTAIALANAIRSRTDVPVTVDSDTLIGTDHPIASSFLSLIQFTAHPGDSAAWKHLLMTPAFCHQNWEDYRDLRRSLGRELLTTIHDAGFAQAFELWLTYLQNGGFVPDAFALRRMEQLRQAAHDFDQKGNRSISDFIHYAEAAATRETPAHGVVQIMTIHKSKGLGFDVVILTDLDRHNNPAITTTQHLSLVAHERGAGLGREIDWVLSMPNRQVCEMDARLLEARRRCEIDRAYEELCVLYVALTRAKFATHIVCSEPKGEPNGSARDLLIAALAQARDAAPQRTLAEETVSVLYAGGDPNWHVARPQPTPAEEPPPFIPPLHRSRRFPPLQRAMPSSAADEGSHGKIRANFLFSRSSSDAAAYGTKLHAVFEQIDWIDSLTANSLEAAVAAMIDPTDSVAVLVRDEVLASLREPTIAALFHRDQFGTDPILWREKRFEIILNGAWVSGTFDRVVLTRERAWIFDFKTNRVATPRQIAEARDAYRPQLSVYREALSRLSGIPAQAIETHLIFTKPAVVAVVAQTDD